MERKFLSIFLPHTCELYQNDSACTTIFSRMQFGNCANDFIFPIPNPTLILSRFICNLNPIQINMFYNSWIKKLFIVSLLINTLISIVSKERVEW